MPEPVQGVMERYGHLEAVVYDSGDNLIDHFHQPNYHVLSLPFREEGHGGPGQF